MTFAINLIGCWQSRDENEAEIIPSTNMGCQNSLHLYGVLDFKGAKFPLRLYVSRHSDVIHHVTIIMYKNEGKDVSQAEFHSESSTSVGKPWGRGRVWWKFRAPKFYFGHQLFVV